MNLSPRRETLYCTPYLPHTRKICPLASIAIGALIIVFILTLANIKYFVLVIVFNQPICLASEIAGWTTTGLLTEELLGDGDGII